MQDPYCSCFRCKVYLLLLGDHLDVFLITVRVIKIAFGVKLDRGQEILVGLIIMQKSGF